MKEVLRQVGLTEKEIEVYLVLLELGEVSVGSILKRTNVSSSKIYEILDRLSKKGLVSRVIIEKIYYFSAAPPVCILDYLDQKKQDLLSITNRMEQLMPQLERAKKPVEEHSVRSYIGYNGLRTAFGSIINTLNRGEEYVGFIVSPEEIKNPLLANFLVQFHKRRAEKGISARMLADYKMRKVYKKEPFVSYKKYQIRFAQQKTLSDIIIFRKSILFYTGLGEPEAFIINSDRLANTFLDFFHNNWEVSRP